MITIGFSAHHVEALPFVREQMERHQVIVLEEPPSDNFDPMLRGDISIENYMMELDPGFPEFDRQLCGLLQELYNAGRRIVQIERHLADHDEQIIEMIKAIKQLLKPDPLPKKRRIGFHSDKH